MLLLLNKGRRYTSLSIYVLTRTEFGAINWHVALYCNHPSSILGYSCYPFLDSEPAVAISCVVVGFNQMYVYHDTKRKRHRSHKLEECKYQESIQSSAHLTQDAIWYFDQNAKDITPKRAKRSALSLQNSQNNVKLIP